LLLRSAEIQPLFIDLQLTQLYTITYSITLILQLHGLILRETQYSLTLYCTLTQNTQLSNTTPLPPNYGSHPAWVAATHAK
jgi:hypothetical protein